MVFFSRKAKLSAALLLPLCGFQGNVLAEDSQVVYLEPVVVTANRTLQGLMEAKSDISVVTRKEIERTHPANLEQALRRLPGIQFLNYGFNGLNANVSRLRLNGSANVLVLVDGVKINDFRGDKEGGSFFASQINNIENIEQVEVLRGSAGMQYGSSAQGGVINIITRKIDGTSTVLDFSGGNFGKKKMNIRTQARNGAFGYSLYCDKSQSGDMVDGAGQKWEGNNDVRSYGVKTEYEFAGGQRISLGYDDFYTHYHGYDPIYTTPYFGNFRKKNLTFQHTASIGNRWQHRFVYRWADETNHYVQTADSGDYVPPWSYAYHIFNEQLTYRSPQHTLVMGIDYNYGRDHLLTNVWVDGENGIQQKKQVRREMKNISVYAQDDWQITDRLSASLGVRYDKPLSDQYVEDVEPYTSYSYKVGYDITPNDSLFVSYNDFYIFPSMGQKYNPDYGNANLEPAYGHTVNVGYNRKFSENNLLTFNWFRTKSERSIGYIPDAADPKKGHYENISDALNRGWNLQWLNQWNQYWTGRIGFSHVYIYADGDTIMRGYYPKNMLTFGINYTNKKWNAGVDGFYFDRYVNPEEPNEGGWPDRKYTIWNLMVSYQANPETSVYMRIDNLFDTLWAEHTHAIWGGGPKAWYSQPGRSINLGVRYTF